LWHDLGKFSAEFQQYIRGSSRHELGNNVDHSTAGAHEAVRRFDVLGHFIAYGIAGHHSGLLDAETGVSLRARLQKTLPKLPAASATLKTICERPSPVLPAFLARSLRQPHSAGFTAQFFTRMLFSCLVDADFLATEAFLNAAHATIRNNVPVNALSQIENRLVERINAFGTPTSDDKVNRSRAEVVADCARKAALAPGFFTLTVPTGGGKTLSSLLFAVRHAIKHGQRRIIYVAPFTSIIEQNADVIRDIIRPLE